MQKQRKESVYEMVEKNVKDKSIFSTSGLHNRSMSEWLLIWILEKVDGSLLLGDINEVISDLTDLVQQAGEKNFYPVFRSPSDGERIAEYGGKWFSEESSLKGLTNDGLLVRGMPCYQASEKGKRGLLEWKRAIAEFLLGIGDEEAVEEVLTKLLETKIKKIIKGKVKEDYFERREGRE